MMAETDKPKPGAEQAPPGVRRPTDDEMKAAFSGPAVHANRFFLTTLPTGVRLSFTEYHGKIVPPQFRTAVMLDFQGAVSLRNLLNRNLKEFEEFLEHEKQQAATQAESEPKANG